MIKTGVLKCPCCGSADIAVDDSDTNKQEAVCNECDHVWILPI